MSEMLCLRSGEDVVYDVIERMTVDVISNNFLTYTRGVRPRGLNVTVVSRRSTLDQWLK